MKFLPESCSSKCVVVLAAKKWEREISWNQTWAKIQWKPEQEFVRGSESERVSMRASHPLLGLYLKTKCNLQSRRCRAQRSRSRWSKWGLGNGHLGPADLWCRPAPWWACRPSPLAKVPFQWTLVSKFECTAKVLLEKIFNENFQRILKLRKYF